MKRVGASDWSRTLRRLGFGLAFAWKFAVLKEPAPLVYGIALTDRCNLSCKGCHIPAAPRPDMSWEHLAATMRSAWSRGFRHLYFSGGEPMLWRDGPRILDDAIAEARRLGFLSVHVYTNGTLGVDSSADMVWVSMDGLPATFAQRRGDCFTQVEVAIRASRHRRLAVIYVVDRNTAVGIEEFLRWVAGTRLPVLGVMFYFHTPYYGRDELFLTAAERAPVIDRLQRCIGQGMPVLNSRAGLRALKTGDWPRRLPVALVADASGEYVCCRAPAEVCLDCGYAACPEIAAAGRLQFSALLAARRYS